MRCIDDVLVDFSMEIVCDGVWCFVKLLVVMLIIFWFIIIVVCDICIVELV